MGREAAKNSIQDLIGALGKGGLGLMDVEQRKNGLRVKIIKKYLDEENKAAWKKQWGIF